MSNRDPHDPDGEYEGHAQQYDSDDEFSRERIAKIFSDYKDTCTREDCYCAQEGWSQVETQEDTFANRAEGWEVSADITTLGDDTCAGEFAREKTVEHILGCALEEITDALEATKYHTQGLIATKQSLALYLNMLTDARNGPCSTF